MKNADKPSYWITKREIFAMAAMQGILADASLDMAGAKTYEGTALDAVRHADALLTELEKQKK